MIIEPSTQFIETYPLLMTATMVDINRGATQKVRVLNPFNEDISAKQDSNIGNAEPYKSIKNIMDMEDKKAVHNTCCVRRIKLGGLGG